MTETRTFNRWRFLAKPRLIFGLLSAILLPLVPMAGAHAGLIINDGLESGSYAPALNLTWAKTNWQNYAQPINGGLFCCNHSFQTVTSPVRSGKYAVKMEYRCGDAFAAGRPRAQFSRAGKGDAGNFAERWYAFSVFVPSNWVNYNDGWLGIFDIHSTTGSLQPLALNIKGASWKVFSYWIGDSYQKTLWTGSTSADKGRWTDWVFHVKFDYRANGGGFLEVWKNGQKIVNYRGPIGDNDSAPYMKIGPQISPNTYYCPRTIYFDNIRIGDQNSSYAEITSGTGGSTSTTTAPSAPSNVNVTAH